MGHHPRHRRGLIRHLLSRKTVLMMNPNLLKSILCWAAMLILSSAAMLSFATWVLVSDTFYVSGDTPSALHAPNHV